jgi:hypothetical protein
MKHELSAAAVLLGLFILLAPARGADNDVAKAVERGVAYLKDIQKTDGSWPRTELGATALAGLALLECGVAAGDGSVRRAAAVVREASPTLAHTYSLALAVLFLDRLGDPADVPLIESMAVRLLAGQGKLGGWSYQCPAVSTDEIRRLRAVLKVRPEPPRSDPEKRREVKDLPREIQKQLEMLNGREEDTGLFSGLADNSNTQFAVLALWIARRHGIPVDRALARVDGRFRGSQGRDGGWGYIPAVSNPAAGVPGLEGLATVGVDSTPAMTCAGLLGLALAYGHANEVLLHTVPADKGPAGAAKKTLDPNKDPAVRAGLLALGTAIGTPAGAERAGAVPRLGPQANGKGYYFLWSLERVAVAYGLDTIGNKDWYGWGSEILLANQLDNGSWAGEYAEGGVDTCFALLFLKRANLAKDLTVALKGKVQDPDSRELKAGGVGGAALASKNVGLKPAFDTGARPQEPSGPPARPGGELNPTRLGEELVRARGEEQERLLEKLRDSKGGAYTEALALAIPRLEGASKTKAREALADRLSRMTAATLAERLQDDYPELRRAAVLACAMKEDKTQVPRLIDLLQDRVESVARAAHAALKSLSGRDFGPDAGAGRAEVARAVAAWKEWWKKQAGK